MNQPELGKKISQLRKAKGLTQGELAEKCNLSLRTIQRIESAEVSPRSYTVKLIFAELDYDIYDSFGKLSYRLDRSAYRTGQWLQHTFKYVLDLFNLKTNTMKKISILSLVALVLTLGFFSLSNTAWGQSTDKVRKQIEEYNKYVVESFNNGEIEKVISRYSEDACILGLGCGKEAVRSFFLSQMNIFKFSELKMTDLHVSDKIAVEKGRWVVVLHSGQRLEGEYLTEWERVGKEWFIVNDISVTKQ